MEMWPWQHRVSGFLPPRLLLGAVGMNVLLVTVSIPLIVTLSQKYSSSSRKVHVPGPVRMPPDGPR